LDATHTLLDKSDKHLLAELAEAVHVSLPSDRQFLLIAENEDNDPDLIRRQETGGRRRERGDKKTRKQGDKQAHIAQPPTANSHRPGYGLDAVWADDFHHQVRVALTHEQEGYYRDYSGSAADLAATIRHGWFYVGQPSAHLGIPRGAPADDLPTPRFVHCIQ